MPRAATGARSAGASARDPVTIACAVILLLIVLAAIFAPWVAPLDPYKTSMLRRLQPLGHPALPGSAPTSSAATCSPA